MRLNSRCWKVGHANKRPVGQWNHYRIAVDKGVVTLEVNGEELNQAVGVSQVAGRIGLQSEGAPIHFKDIRLTPLDKGGVRHAFVPGDEVRGAAPDYPVAMTIRGPMSELYDVLVDWKGRLGRELPGIEGHLNAVGARRVLDVGCGTGQHVAALIERGYDVHGADASEDMLARARAGVGEPARIHAWQLGEPPPASLRDAGPFDAVICMGNMWPSLRSEAEVSAACAGLLEVLRPGAGLLLGLKAQGMRQASGNPYMPLMRRVHQGRPIWFVRFVDFERPPLADGTAVCDLHITVVAGDSSATQPEALLHTANAHRVWMPAELGARFEAEGFEQVRVSGRIDDPEVVPKGEDIFLSARSPS